MTVQSADSYITDAVVEDYAITGDPIPAFTQARSTSGRWTNRRI